MIYIQNCISLNALLVNMDENHHFPLISRVKIFLNFKLGINRHDRYGILRPLSTLNFYKCMYINI